MAKKKNPRVCAINDYDIEKAVEIMLNNTHEEGDIELLVRIIDELIIPIGVYSFHRSRYFGFLHDALHARCK